MISFDIDKLLQGKLTKHDFASVELQLVECMNLLFRKDNDQLMTSQELGRLNKRIRKYIMMQDLLYKAFAEEYFTFNKTIKAYQTEKTEHIDKIEELKTKNITLEYTIE